MSPKGVCLNTGRTHFKKGEPSIFKGKTHTEESRKKMREHMKGRTPWNKGTEGVMVAWNKGLTGVQTAWNKGIPMSDETKEKLSLAKIGRRTGVANNMWKGGITPATNKRIANPKWKKLRKQVYERDNWTCQVCHKKCHDDIQCHHIVPYRISKSHRPENLITLCKSCHFKEDLKYMRLFAA